MACDGPCCVTAHTGCRPPAVQAAQWEAPAKRAVIVLSAGEIYSCPKQPAFFPLSHLHHGHANKVLNMRQKPINRRGFFDFLLHVVVWPWTVLHAGVITTQSAPWHTHTHTQGQTRASEPIIRIRVTLNKLLQISKYVSANQNGVFFFWIFCG